MYQTAPAQITYIEKKEDTGWRRLCTVGAFVVLTQLVCVFATICIVITVGAEPRTAEEYYTLLQNDRVVAFLRFDFPTLIQLSLMPLTALALYAALRESNGAYATLATALVLLGVALGLCNHSAFSMIHLGDQYAAATTIAQRDLLMAAGEAIIATDMWNSTAGFLAGIFMQGAFLFISAVMLRGREFSKATACAGIGANGLDLAHVFVGLLDPSLAAILLSIGGLFYLAWFPLLSRDLYRLGRS